MHTRRAPKILVVDADDDAREIALMSLETGGFHVVGAKDGVEGLEKARHESFDAVLIDPRIPEPRDLICALNDEETPILLFRPEEGPPGEADLPRWGAVGSIKKPFAPDLLAVQVAQLLKFK